MDKLLLLPELHLNIAGKNHKHALVMQKHLKNPFLYLTKNKNMKKPKMKNIKRTFKRY